MNNTIQKIFDAEQFRLKQERERIELGISYNDLPESLRPYAAAATAAPTIASNAAPPDMSNNLRYQAGTQAWAAVKALLEFNPTTAH